MLETTFAVLAAAQAGMTCYGILLITGGGEMPEQTREFWRAKWFIPRLGENGVKDFMQSDGIRCEDVIRELRKFVERGTVTDVVVQHIRETILSEEKIGAGDEASV